MPLSLSSYDRLGKAISSRTKEEQLDIRFEKQEGKSLHNSGEACLVLVDACTEGELKSSLRGIKRRIRLYDAGEAQCRGRVT